MKTPGYQFPQSSFLSIDKDMGKITELILKNNRLKKLLYYTTPDALSKDNLDEEQTISLIDKNVKIVPKLYVDGSVLAYIIINFDNFTPTSNPEYRDNVISFDIICHFDQWKLKDFSLRPYKIAGELDTMFNNQKLSGIGELQFLGANNIVLNDEFGGITLMYTATHGGDDKYNPAPTEDEEELDINFDEIFNNLFGEDDD